MFIKTEGMHACKECNKKFFQRQSLIEHMNTHKDTKAFSCEFCAQSFVMSSSLIKHRKANNIMLIRKFFKTVIKNLPEWGFWKKTRMTTFIKTKLKISDDQTNIDKYRLAANITVYLIISKLILQRIIITNFCGPVGHLRESTISDLESPSKFQVKEEKNYWNRSINIK